MSKTANIVWNNCLAFIQENIPPQAYKTWFEPIKLVKLTGNELSIQVPSMFFYEWLEEHYVKLLKVALTKELGESAKLVYVIKVENTYGNRESVIKKITSKFKVNLKSEELDKILLQKNEEFKNPFSVAGIRDIIIESQLNPNYNFDNFIEGNSNRLARSASMAVANRPGGTSYNPLYIYADDGIGKTHLVHAIGVEIKDRYPERTVLYISAEKFTQQYIESVKENTRNDFIHFYELIDVLIVDDVQFLSGKSGTQDVFFHIFNHLHQNGKQVILTSDKAPVDMQDFEQHLLSRFKWGLSVEIETPDYKTRVSILRNKLYRDGVEMPNDIVDYVAKHVKTNIRELEGVIISLIAQSSFNKREITIELAQSVVGSFVLNNIEFEPIKQGKSKNRKIKDVIMIHDHLKTAFMKYLLGFDEYVNETKSKIISFKVRKVKKGVELKVKLNEDITVDEIKNYINEYVDLIREEKVSLSDKITVDVLQQKVDFLDLKYQSQVNQFKMDLKFKEFEINSLKENLDYFKDVFQEKYKQPKIDLRLTQNQYVQNIIPDFIDIKNDLLSFFNAIEDNITNSELKNELSEIKKIVNEIEESNIDEIKKSDFGKKIKSFLKGVKKSVNNVTWTQKSVESILKSKSAVQKFAKHIGIDINELLEEIIKYFEHIS